jgi:hypothetical protein
MLLLLHHTGEMLVIESILVGGSGDSGRQLRPDDGGTNPRAVGTVGRDSGVVAMVFVRHSILYYMILHLFL